MSFVALTAELIAVIIIVAVARQATPIRQKSSTWLERAFNNIARRRSVAVVTAGLIGFLVSATFCVVRIPGPRILDEFCYLLSADTFAHGRLTNPTHPFSDHFQNIYILQTPSYQSKYPPGQGLLLALGQVLGGHSIMGVWLGSGLACAATCWMLQAWLPPRWALFGGLLPVIRFGIFLDDHMSWSRSYWGGMVAVVGGALLFGGLARSLRRPSLFAGIAIGSGLAVLALSRPFEGLVAALIVSCVWVRDLFARPEWPRRTALFRDMAVAFIVVLAAVAFTMFYNRQVTGDPMRLPYVEHASQYNPIPNFAWGSMSPLKTYRHEAIRNFYESSNANDGLAQQYSLLQTWQGRLRFTLAKLSHAWLFFVGPALTVPLILCHRRLWQSPRARFAALTVALGLVAFVLVNWRPVQYMAPFACLIVFLAVQSLRDLKRLRIDRTPVGRFLADRLVVICVVSFLVSFVELTVWSYKHERYPRAIVTAKLNDRPGKHLVFVRYAPDQASNAYLVYNLAEIDAQRIVWARELSAQQNERLMAYFSERHVWLIRADQQPFRIVPYDEVTPSRNAAQ